MLRLRTLLGNHAHLAPLKNGSVRSPHVVLHFADEPQPHEAFKPFVRDLAFDCGELAIVTFLQAFAYGKPLVLLPIVVSSRFHHGSICYNSARGVMAPKDLEGRAVAVRTYSQTTGVWVRGILQHEYDVDLERVTWVTCDEAHLSEYTDPTNTRRAGPGCDPDTLLRDGNVAAAIPISLASKALYGPPYKTLVPKPEVAACAWYERDRIVPLNHLFVVRKSVLEESPVAVREVIRMLRESKEQSEVEPMNGVDMVPFGVEESRRSLEMVVRFAHEQQIIGRRFAVDELFADVRGLL
jgi:4,5-dihydroxyphthalate decarboxylase